MFGNRGEPEIFRILICNDHQPETAFLKGLLAEEGYHVEVSQGIEELLHNIAFKSYQALILGVDIEGRKGIEAIPWVRAIDMDIPIITIVGQDSIETQKKVREQKVFYYFVRPINPQEMKAVLKGVFLSLRRRNSPSRREDSTISSLIRRERIKKKIKR